MLVAAACGEGTSRPGAGEVPTALEVAEQAVALLGDDATAGLAILVALDRGYTFAQVVDAVLSGSLLASGVVFDGEVVSPAGVASDLIVDKGPLEAEASAAGVVFIALASGPSISMGELEQLVREMTLPEQAVATLWLLSLGEAGYSAEQIILGLVFGDVVCVSRPGAPDCRITGEDPEHPPAEGVLALPEAVEEDAPEPTEPGQLADGNYFSGDEFRPDYGDDVTIDFAEVVLEIADGRYTLWVTVEYTRPWSSADGSFSCTTLHDEAFQGQGADSGSSIRFEGRMENFYDESCSTPTGPTHDSGLFSSSDNWTVTVHLTEDRYLQGTYQGGDFQLVRIDG